MLQLFGRLFGSRAISKKSSCLIYFSLNNSWLSNKAFITWLHSTNSYLIIRGGVEDARLEAKAKDTKKSKAKAKDSLSEDRHSRGQGQECSWPRPRTKDTSASALRKKKVFTKIFHAISRKKRFPKKFLSTPQNFNNSKNSAVLEPRTGQFSRTWGLEAKAKTWPSRPRTSSGTPPLLKIRLLLPE